MTFNSQAKTAKTLVVAFLMTAGFGAGWWGQKTHEAARGRLLQASSPETAPADKAPSPEAHALPPVAPVAGTAATEVEAMPVARQDTAAILDEAERLHQRILPSRAILDGFPAYRAIDSGKISDALADLLQLTAAERAAADRALAAAAERLRQLELPRTQLAIATDTEAVFQVGAFADQGAAVREAFRDDLLRGVTGDVGEILHELTTRENRYDGYWTGWGEEAKEIRFSLEPNRDQPGEYWVKFGAARAGAYTTPEGREESHFARMSPYAPIDRWTTYETVAGRHQYLAHLLPEPLRSLFHPGSVREPAP
jgi:hypothetical protein